MDSDELTLSVLEIDKNVTLSVKASGGDTVRDVKDKLDDLLFIHPVWQILSLGDKKLEDDLPLGLYDIQDGAQLTLKLDSGKRTISVLDTNDDQVYIVEVSRFDTAGRIKDMISGLDGKDCWQTVWLDMLPLDNDFQLEVYGIEEGAQLTIQP